MSKYKNAWLVSGDEILSQPLTFGNTHLKGQKPNGVLLVSSPTCPACIRITNLYQETIDKLNKHTSLVGMIYEINPSEREKTSKILSSIEVEAFPTFIVVKDGFLTSDRLIGGTSTSDELFMKIKSAFI